MKTTKYNELLRRRKTVEAGYSFGLPPFLGPATVALQRRKPCIQYGRFLVFKLGNRIDACRLGTSQ
jgi:hypothetical protein